MTWKLLTGDCRVALASLADASFDAIVTDPPYELGFMGKRWDASGVAFDPATWREMLRLAKPGAHLLAFGGTRTYHRMVCAIEDVGFEIRDSIDWLYGQGFPKSHNLDGEHEGKGTALKPGHEPIVLARKPLKGTVEANVREHGTGAINIEACRVGVTKRVPGSVSNVTGLDGFGARTGRKGASIDDSGHDPSIGRWPPNVVLTHSAECRRVGARKVKAAQVGDFPAGVNRGPTMGKFSGTARTFDYADADGTETVPAFDCAPDCPVAELDRQSGDVGTNGSSVPFMRGANSVYGDLTQRVCSPVQRDNVGGASRFFPTFEWDPIADVAPFLYCAKADTAERDAGLHHRKRRKVNDGRESAIDNAYQRGESLRANTHPTVKPLALMRWLVRLVTPRGGVILDPFAGSGTTIMAALRENLSIVGCELEPAHVDLARDRIVGDAPLLNAGGASPR